MKTKLRRTARQMSICLVPTSPGHDGVDAIVWRRLIVRLNFEIRYKLTFSNDNYLPLLSMGAAAAARRPII